MEISTLPRLSRRLRMLFSTEEAVRLGFVFGSQVDGYTGPLSDLDVAVFVTDACLENPTACRARLAHEIHSRVEINDVDLVLLSKAPIELAYHIIADGERIYEADRTTRVEYEAYVLSRYGDFQAHRETVFSDHSR